MHLLTVNPSSMIVNVSGIAFITLHGPVILGRSSEKAMYCSFYWMYLLPLEGASGIWIPILYILVRIVQISLRFVYKLHELVRICC